jgi:aldose 1-epimerase
MIRANPLICFLISLLAMAASLSASAPTPTVTVAPFGKMPDGQPVSLYTLVNARGMKADITNYGGIIVRLYAPDRRGVLDDVVLGYDSLQAYLKATPYFGALIGRVGNRIAHGRFTLEGKTYDLATNNSPGGMRCHLHGGNVGFDKVLWEAEPFISHDAAGLRLTYRSADGEEGYPGNLLVTVTYSLDNENALKVKYAATTDKPTPVNLTQHSYFNLKGEGMGDILGHVLTIKASRMTPVNAGLIPTGAITPVADTPFDFTSPHAIGERVNASDQQIEFGGGYDHNWVLDRTSGELELAATVFEPVSGRTMEVWTKEPGIQFYCGNFLDGSAIGKRGHAYPFRGGFCLETQHYPDSPNQPGFPSIILQPGQTYATETVYRFGAK